MSKDTTFKELKKSDYKNQTINQEIQANLIARIKANQPSGHSKNYRFKNTSSPGSLLLRGTMSST